MTANDFRAPASRCRNAARECFDLLRQEGVPLVCRSTQSSLNVPVVALHSQMRAVRNSLDCNCLGYNNGPARCACACGFERVDWRDAKFDTRSEVDLHRALKAIC